MLCLWSLRSTWNTSFFSFYILLSFTVALRIAWSPHTDIIDSLYPEFNYKETSDKSKYHSSCFKYTWYPRMMLVDIFQRTSLIQPYEAEMLKENVFLMILICTDFFAWTENWWHYKLGALDKMLRNLMQTNLVRRITRYMMAVLSMI